MSDMLLKIVFQDYERRKLVIANQNCPSVMRVAYMYMNEVIDEELEIAYMRTPLYIPEFKKEMFNDIAQDKGYNESALKSSMSVGTYRKYKKRIKEAVIKRLAL